MSNAGRKPVAPEDRRTAAVPVRFRAAEKELVQQAAEKEGVSISVYVRNRALAAAKRALRS